MAAGAKSIADQINRGSKDLEAGQIQIWGAPAVRPNDAFYKLAQATAQGNILRLELEDQGGGRWVLAIHDPDGLKSAATELQITKASRISWGPSGGPGNDFVAGGPPALRLIG